MDGMWTVIQKRSDGSEDFYRNWTDHKEGFGDVSGEYWLGNDVIHHLTSQANYTLTVVLTDWDNIAKYAEFSTFNIADEADSYRLSIRGYFGDAGDALMRLNKLQFSTRDRDNDGKVVQGLTVRKQRTKKRLLYYHFVTLPEAK